MHYNFDKKFEKDSEFFKRNIFIYEVISDFTAYLSGSLYPLLTQKTKIPSNDCGFSESNQKLLSIIGRQENDAIQLTPHISILRRGIIDSTKSLDENYTGDMMNL